MKDCGFDHIPRVDVQFTKEEVDFLLEVARTHYDYKCRATASEGGLLYGLKNTFEVFDAEWGGRVSLMSRELGTLIKLLEMPTHNAELASSLNWNLRKFQGALAKEYSRITKGQPEETGAHLFNG